MDAVKNMRRKISPAAMKVVTIGRQKKVISAGNVRVKRRLPILLW
jgi:hypothetical protein